MGISAILCQDGKRVALFGEKLNDSRKNYSTYDKEFYMIYQAFKSLESLPTSKTICALR